MKKNVLFLIIGFSITSNSTAMLTKFSKKSLSNFSQIGLRNHLYIHTNRYLDFEEEEDGYNNPRQKHLRRAFYEKDFPLINFILGDNGSDDRRVYIDDTMMSDVTSIEMLQMLEKHGLDIKKVKTNGGNFLHHLISETEVNDDIIQYVLDKGVNPSEVDDYGNNLWHELADFPQHNINKIKNRALLLCKLGVDLYLKNNQDQLPVDVLEEKIQYLIDREKWLSEFERYVLEVRRELKTFMLMQEAIEKKINRE